MRPRLALLVAPALIAAACGFGAPGGSDADEAAVTSNVVSTSAPSHDDAGDDIAATTTDGATEPAADGTQLTTPEDDAGSSDVADATTTTVAESGSGAVSLEPTGAAATFSEDHLSLGAGSQFVPVDVSAYVPASEATWLDPTDVVLGVVKGDVAVAFPVMQMQYHHIANIEVAGEPYLVTY